MQARVVCVFFGRFWHTAVFTVLRCTLQPSDIKLLETGILAAYEVAFQQKRHDNAMSALALSSLQYADMIIITTCRYGCGYYRPSVLFKGPLYILPVVLILQAVAFPSHALPATH